MITQRKFKDPLMLLLYIEMIFTLHQIQQLSLLLIRITDVLLQSNVNAFIVTDLEF